MMPRRVFYVHKNYIIILSGDNALVIGMAAAGLAPKQRKKAIAIGMAMAAGMRILFAVIASYLLAIKGILLVGGLLLSWVCWRFYLDLKEFNQASVDTIEAANSEGASRDNGKSEKFLACPDHNPYCGRIDVD